MELKIGQRVEITKMAKDSFYVRVRGEVTEVRNGFISVVADEVMDRWSRTWEKHPSSCRTGGRKENVVAI